MEQPDDAQVQPPDHPPVDGNTTLLVSAWHLQILLAGLAGLDSKFMFLTALNVAGISALIGIAAAADPIVWLLSLSILLSSIGVVLGLARIWSMDVVQFPTPQDALATAISAEGRQHSAAWHNHYAVMIATLIMQEKLVRRQLVLRLILALTLLALGLTIASALTASI